MGLYCYMYTFYSAALKLVIYYFDVYVTCDTTVENNEPESYDAGNNNTTELSWPVRLRLKYT